MAEVAEKEDQEAEIIEEVKEVSSEVLPEVQL